MDDQHQKYKRISGQVMFSNIILVLTILVTPALIALLTRVLSVEHYGVYSLLSAFVSLFSLLLVFGLSNYVSAKLPGKAHNEQAKSFFSVLSVDTVLLVIILLLAFFTPVKGWFLNFTHMAAYEAEYGVCLLLIFLLALSKMFFAFFHARQRLNIVNTMEFILSKGWMFLLFALFFLWHNFTVLSVLTVWLIGTLATIIIYTALAWSDLKLFLKSKFNTPVVREAIIFSLPIIPVIISGWLISISNRYMINHFISIEAVGIYTLVYSLLGTIRTFGTSASIVIMPYFAEAWNKGGDCSKFISASVKFGLLIILPALSGLFAIGKQVIVLISGEKYLPAAPYILPLLLYPLFYFLSGVFYDSLLVASETKQIGVAYVMSAILTVVMNLILIPKYQLSGAVISTTISYLLMAVYMYVVFRKHFKLNMKYIKAGRILVACAVMTAVAYLMNPQGNWMTLVTVMVSGIVYGVLLLVLRVISKTELQLIFSKIPVLNRIADKILKVDGRRHPESC